jgi:hypothetical protein
MSAAGKTTDHDASRPWAEVRDGHPARVEGTGGEGGPLRIDVGEQEERFEKIGRDAFHRIEPPRHPPSGRDFGRRQEPLRLVRFSRCVTWA